MDYFFNTSKKKDSEKQQQQHQQQSSGGWSIRQPELVPPMSYEQSLRNSSIHQVQHSLKELINAVKQVLEFEVQHVKSHDETQKIHISTANEYLKLCQDLVSDQNLVLFSSKITPMDASTPEYM